MRRSVVVALVATATCLGLIAEASGQSPKREAPSQQPFYFRTVTGAGEWSLVVFYRDPECVPEDYNYIDFFDAPRAFGCPATVDTFSVWETGPGQDRFGPRQGRVWGDEVPIWFVRTEDLIAARLDGDLTIGELESLDPLVGTADFYTEVLHPTNAARNPIYIANGRGTLDDGREFTFHVAQRTLRNNDRDNDVVRIDIED